MRKTGEVQTPLSRSDIIKVKTRALRKGVWYRVLTKVERACIDLVIEVVDRVRSRLLIGVLSSVLRKLDAAMESQVWRLMREIGGKLASKMSQIAQDWGNKSAVHWVKDSGFVQYLIITQMNAP
jgi:hypothetical protein